MDSMGRKYITAAAVYAYSNIPATQPVKILGKLLRRCLITKPGPLCCDWSIDQYFIIATNIIPHLPKFFHHYHPHSHQYYQP